MGTPHLGKIGLRRRLILQFRLRVTFLIGIGFRLVIRTPLLVAAATFLPGFLLAFLRAIVLIMAETFAVVTFNTVGSSFHCYSTSNDGWAG